MIFIRIAITFLAAALNNLRNYATVWNDSKYMDFAKFYVNIYHLFISN